MVDNEETPFNDEKESKKQNQNKEKYTKSENDNRYTKLNYYSDINNNNEEKEKNNETPKNVNNQNADNGDINIDIENDELSQSLKNILLDKQFASPVIIKKENKLISDYHYVTFKNAYAENSCFVNVILHLLYYIPELDEFLISLYEIDAANKDEKDATPTPNDKKEVNKFLVLLGKILYEYEATINQENDKEYRRINTPKSQVTVIKTLNMRKVLANISSNKFPLNTIADPVELFTFILDILNENLNEDLHKSFYLELIDEYICKSNKNCENIIKNKYDKDNFIYHIYIDEILKYIEQNNMKVKDYKNKLFELSYKLFLSENYKTCEKCKEDMAHNLVCMNNPQFLLINCVWKESNPIVDDVISLFFLMSLKDELNNLFCYNNNNRRSNKRNSYYLLGFILYCFTLSHYIACFYNYEKKIFVLLDDEVAKEYNNIYELILDITVNILKVNEKAFFYPVMLIFTQEAIFDSRIIKFNTLADKEYSNIIKKCNEAIEEYQIENKMKEEEKMNNYKDFIEKQKEIENNIKRRNNKKRSNNDNINQKEIETNEKKVNDKIITDKKEINETENNDKEQKNINRYRKDNKDFNDKQMNNKEINELEVNNRRSKKNSKNKSKNNSKNKKYTKYDNSDNNENNENNEGTNKMNEEIESNNLKKGINNINQTKIGLILKDLRKFKGDRNNNINIDDLKDLEKIHNRNNEKKEISDNNKNDYNNNNNIRKNRYYKSQRVELNNNKEEKEKEENLDKENKELYKRRTNLGENKNYYNNTRDQKRTYNPNIQDKNEQDDITNKRNNYGNDNNLTNNNKENENKRRRGNYMFQSTNNIISNNRFKENKDNKTKEDKNSNEENRIKDINKGINNTTNIYEREYPSNKGNNNKYSYTPKKDNKGRFHSNLLKNAINKDINEDNYTRDPLYNRSEKKTNFMSQFIGKKMSNPNFKQNTNTDENNNSVNQKKEEENNINKNGYNGRRYYLRYSNQ